MEWGAEIIAMDGKPITEVVDNNVPWSSPFSNPVSKHLQQLRYATRFPLSKGSVELEFQNPGGARETKRIHVVNEADSFQPGFILRRGGARHAARRIQGAAQRAWLHATSAASWTMTCSPSRSGNGQCGTSTITRCRV